MPSLVANTVAAVALMGTGDAASQAVEIHLSKRKKEEHFADDVTFQPQEYCAARTGRIAASGIFSALTMTPFYSALDLLLPGTQFSHVVAKALIDNVLFCPVYYAGMLGLNALMACGDVADVFEHDFVPILQVNFLVFFPFDLIAYTFIPSPYWVISYKVIDVLYIPLYSYFANRRLDLEFKEKRLGAAPSVESLVDRIAEDVPILNVQHLDDRQRQPQAKADRSRCCAVTGNCALM
jgi:hypothetical protein